MPATDRLVPDKIKANTKRIGREILVYESTTSTNDIAAACAKNAKNDGLAIFAEEQTEGRGRGSGRWVSGRGESILCSILLTKADLPSELVSLVCAVATAEAIGKTAKNEARIKWPNDIILGGKKVAGILVESKGVDGGNAYILGIGINCHQTKESFPARLRPAATSIDIESGRVCDRISLARRLLSCMEHWLEAAGRDSRQVTQQWAKLSIQVGHRVKLVFNGNEFMGNCIGVDPEKGLIVQLDSGGVRMFDAAHTTIAK